MGLAGSAGQAENDSESMINLMEVVSRQQTMRLSQAAGIDRANLFDQDASARAFDLYFRSEGGRKGVSRRRGDDNCGQSQQLVRLENNPKPPTRRLLAAFGAWSTKSEDFTPLHVGIPSPWRFFSSRLGPLDQRSLAPPHEQGQSGAGSGLKQSVPPAQPPIDFGLTSSGLLGRVEQRHPAGSKSPGPHMICITIVRQLRNLLRIGPSGTTR